MLIIPCDAIISFKAHELVSVESLLQGEGFHNNNYKVEVWWWINVVEDLCGSQQDSNVKQKEKRKTKNNPDISDVQVHLMLPKSYS